MDPKQKQYPVVDVTGNRNKVQCYKEQYCIGTWNVRSMNQGKLEVVKQMARVNINILGIRELKWTGMGEFNSDEHYIYYCGQESLRRNGVAMGEELEGLQSRGLQRKKRFNQLNMLFSLSLSLSLSLSIYIYIYIYIYNGILFSYKIEGNIAICDNTDEL